LGGDELTGFLNFVFFIFAKVPKKGPEGLRIDLSSFSDFLFN
jgi:hypothetical protein